MNRDWPQSAVGFGARSSDTSRGSDQSGVRLYNERLALTLIRRHDSLTQADIARLTGLSPQTCSVIMKELETAGMVRRGARRKGRVGQPSVPYSLNPDGAFALGLKIGRRSSELILVDLVGRVRRALQETYPYPTPAGVLKFVAGGLDMLTSGGDAGIASDRIAGLGVAVPYELWRWEEETGAPRAVLDEWRKFELEGELGKASPLPMHLCNDGTAACAAELAFGNTAQHQHFLYFFIGTFIGGGVALDGALFPGITANAGAVGSMPIGSGAAADGAGREQLIRRASLYELENRLLANGRDPAVIWQSPADWGDLGPVVDSWVETACESLALAIVSAISVIDFGAVIVDGAVPMSVRQRIVEGTAAHIESLDRRGLSPVTIHEGAIGSGAQAKGAASLPLLANFARSREVLFKDPRRSK